MILLRLLKLLLNLLKYILVWTFGLLFIIFVISFITVLIIPSNIQDDFSEQKSTKPFDDSIFHKFKNQFHQTEQRNYSASNKLKIIENCIAQIPNSSYIRTWTDYNNNLYENTFNVNKGIVCEASYNRNELSLEWNEFDNSYWNTIYSQIVKFDTTKMNFIYDYFEKIKQEKQLDYVDFANMVVSFVQSIPYTLIISTSKEEAIQSAGFVRDYLLNNRGPYVENIKYGFLSPLEFFYCIKGDCDTRTLAIYAILSHFGYDVVILNCSVHSMIGLNIPSQGKALKYRGKKYYFWETTATGWQLGQLPVEYETTNDWYVALPSVNDF